MSKPIIRRILITAVILLILVVIYRNRIPFGKSNSSFSCEPSKEITKIELSQGRKRLSLEKKANVWLLNGKVETRKSGVYFIVRILKEIKIKSPVSKQLFDSEITSKGITPVKVKVYEKRKLIKSFLVYKTASNSFGNIMKMREGAKPFIVYVPGYDGDIGSGFTMNELFWQPYSLFNLLPSEIASIDFENFSDTTNSFSITNRNHKYSVTDRVRDLAGWDSTLVTRYLSYFTWIPFESWALDIGKPEQKIIESKRPLYRITVSSDKGAKIILTLWEKARDNQSPTPDSDRLYGKTGAKDDLFIIRYFDIDPIIKKKSYFFSK
jgi:hypothetical protein